MSETIYLTTLMLPCATILLVFGMKYLAATRQAHARLAEESTYRQLATASAQSQADTARLLASMQAAVAQLDERLGRVEQILTQID